MKPAPPTAADLLRQAQLIQAANRAAQVRKEKEATLLKRIVSA